LACGLLAEAGCGSRLVGSGDEVFHQHRRCPRGYPPAEGGGRSTGHRQARCREGGALSGDSLFKAILRINAAPLPGPGLSARMYPPCRSISALLMARAQAGSAELARGPGEAGCRSKRSPPGQRSSPVPCPGKAKRCQETPDMLAWHRKGPTGKDGIEAF